MPKRWGGPAEPPARPPEPGKGQGLALDRPFPLEGTGPPSPSPLGSSRPQGHTPGPKPPTQPPARVQPQRSCLTKSGPRSGSQKWGAGLSWTWAPGAALLSLTAASRVLALAR